MGEKKPKYNLLKKEDVREWMNLVVKVNQGYELDDRETEKLGCGIMAIDMKNLPDEIKNMIIKAEKYYNINNTKIKIK